MRVHETDHRKQPRRYWAALLLAALLLLGSAAPVAAQASDRPGPTCGPDPVRVAARVLNLSEEQHVAWKEILDRRQASLRPIQGEIRRRERRLQQLLGEDEPNPLSVGSLLIEISELREQIEQIQEASGNELLATLDERQLAMVDEVAAAAPLVPAVHSFQALDLI